jgi:hypothetical protein
VESDVDGEFGLGDVENFVFGSPWSQPDCSPVKFGLVEQEWFVRLMLFAIYSAIKLCSCKSLGLLDDQARQRVCQDLRERSIFAGCASPVVLGYRAEKLTLPATERLVSEGPSRVAAVDNQENISFQGS